MLKLYNKKHTLEAFVDEVARGCLVGRVYASVVIWNPDLLDIWKDTKEYEYIYRMMCKIKDSKKVKPAHREELCNFIQNYAVDYAVAWVDEKTVDTINIRNATFKAMHLALDKLQIIPSNIIIDGNAFEPYNRTETANIPYECIVKCDDTYLPCAAASILAKTTRDNYLLTLIDENPILERYGWRHNKGYGTKDHLDAIKKYGISEYHRKSYKPCQITLDNNV